MVHFRKKNNYIMKVDPLNQLKGFIRVWGQIDKLMIIYLIVLTIKIVSFLLRVLFIFVSNDDLDILLEVAAAFPIPILAIVKMTFLLLKRDAVRKLISSVKEKFWDINVAGNKLRIQLDKRFKYINLFLWNHSIVTMCYILLDLAFPYVPIPAGRTRRLPLLIVFPLNQDKTPTYEILFVILTWNMFISAFGNGFYDFLFVYTAQHLCGQFILLRGLLKNLDYKIMEHEEDIKKFNSSKFQKEIENRIKICVKHHNLLLSYGQQLKELTSLVFGIQLLLTLAALVLMGYTLSNDFEEVTKSTMLLSFVVSSTLQFVLFALQSTDIYNQSSSISEAAYQCNWHLFRANAKKGLTLLIMNSQKGIIMYGAGVIPIKNEIIVEMGQKVFSCITLLKSLGG